MLTAPSSKPPAPPWAEGKAVASSDSPSVPEVSAEDAISEVSRGVTVVDVREQSEWDAGHIAGAQLVPLSELEERAVELPLATRLLIVCHSGMRSRRATTFLRSHGVDAVNVDGGMMAWAASGGAVSAVTTPANTDET